MNRVKKVKNIVLATENRGKYQEFFALASPYSLALQALWEQKMWIKTQKSTNELEAHSPKTSYTNNAKSKARAIHRLLRVNTLADDSGLEIDSLGGEPGIRSANYIPTTPGSSYQDTVLPFILKEMAGKKNRKARFICSLVLCLDSKEIEAKGICEGEIGERATGLGGFGYDPIFFPKQHPGKSMAQLSFSEKNTISHRALAFKDLIATLMEQDLL